MDRSTLLLLANKLTATKSEQAPGVLAGPCLVTVSATSADGTTSASWEVGALVRGEDSARALACPSAAILDHLVASAGLVPGLREALVTIMLDVARGMKAPACAGEHYRKIVGAAGLPTMGTIRGSVDVVGVVAVVAAEDCDGWAEAAK